MEESQIDVIGLESEERVLLKDLFTEEQIKKLQEVNPECKSIHELFTFEQSRGLPNYKYVEMPKSFESSHRAKVILCVHDSGREYGNVFAVRGCTCRIDISNRVIQYLEKQEWAVSDIVYSPENSIFVPRLVYCKAQVIVWNESSWIKLVYCNLSADIRTNIYSYKKFSAPRGTPLLELANGDINPNECVVDVADIARMIQESGATGRVFTDPYSLHIYLLCMLGFPDERFCLDDLVSSVPDRDTFLFTNTYVSNKNERWAQQHQMAGGKMLLGEVVEAFALQKEKLCFEFSHLRQGIPSNDRLTVRELSVISGHVLVDEQLWKARKAFLAFYISRIMLPWAKRKLLKKLAIFRACSLRNDAITEKFSDDSVVSLAGKLIQYVFYTSTRGSFTNSEWSCIMNSMSAPNDPIERERGFSLFMLGLN